jgi:hypothetical protein
MTLEQKTFVLGVGAQKAKIEPAQLARVFPGAPAPATTGLLRA